MCRDDDIDWDQIGNDAYVRSLKPDKLQDLVVKWDVDFFAWYYGRDLTIDTNQLLQLTDAVAMVVESRGLDSSVLVPAFKKLKDNMDLNGTDEEAVVLLLERLETRFRWECAASPPVELGGLGDFEKDVIEAIGDDSMQAEAISQAIGQDNNSHFRGKLAAMVKRRILRSDRSGGNGYRVLPPFNRLYK